MIKWISFPLQLGESNGVAVGKVPLKRNDIAAQSTPSLRSCTVPSVNTNYKNEEHVASSLHADFTIDTSELSYVEALIDGNEEHAKENHVRDSDAKKDEVFLEINLLTGHVGSKSPLICE